MFLPSKIFGHVAYNHVAISPDENNNIKKRSIRNTVNPLYTDTRYNDKIRYDEI